MSTPSWFTHPLNRRAPRGGDVNPLNGRAYKPGEFEPFYVPRAVMPQIDDAKYPDLLAFAAQHGVIISEEIVDPHALHPHQHVDALRVKQLEQSPEALTKQLLVALDSFILDGNHRWLGHVYEKTPAPVYRVHLEFEAAIAFLFSFPGCYSYGDGAVHPVTY